MQVGSQKSNIKGIAVARDVDGFPKLGKDAAVKFWPMLNAKDREYLKEKYSLNLEINNG